MVIKIKKKARRFVTKETSHHLDKVVIESLIYFQANDGEEP